MKEKRAELHVNAIIFVTNNRRVSTRLSAPTFFSKNDGESSDQVFVLVSTVISRLTIDRSEKKSARENARVISSFVVVATLVYSLFRSTCIYANTDANPPVFEMICSIIASGCRRMKEIWMGEKEKNECATSELWWREIKSPYCNKTDTSIRIMNKPKRSACSRDVTNINKVFFFALYNGREINARMRTKRVLQYILLYILMKN